MREMDADVTRQEVESRRSDKIFAVSMAFLAVVGLSFLSFVIYSQFVPIYVG